MLAAEVALTKQLQLAVANKSRGETRGSVAASVL